MVIINPGSKKKAIWNFSVRDTHTMSKCAVLTPVCRLVEISFFWGGGAESPNKGNTSVHMLQLFVFTIIEDIESEKETAVVFHHDGTPSPPVNPLQSCVSTCLECKVSIREVKEVGQQHSLKVFHISNRWNCCSWNTQKTALQAQDVHDFRSLAKETSRRFKWRQ